MKISELQQNCMYNCSDMEEVKNCHPKQIISEGIYIPVWKILYNYKTNRGNDRQACKYIFLEESSYDLVDSEFVNHIKELNKMHPERKISNVEILDISFLGKIYLELE